MDEVTYTLTVTGGGDMTGASVHVTRTSPWSKAEQYYIIGELLSEDGNTRVYAMTEAEAP